MKSVNDILAPDWFSYMNYLSGGDKVIHYSWKKSGLSKTERKEIKSIFQEIDELTGLSFVKTKKKDDDDIVDTRERYVLRHEIGHALGLSHPRGEGAHPDFTSEDTIMSYNVYGEWSGLTVFRYFGFTDLDKQALQYNWGPNPEDIILGDNMDIIEEIPSM